MTSILVVEDHPVFVQSLVRLLRERGKFEATAVGILRVLGIPLEASLAATLVLTTIVPSWIVLMLIRLMV